MEGRLSRAIRWIAVVAAAVHSGLAIADSVNSEWSSSARAESMGNVGIAAGDDADTGAFYNPAALARIKRLSVEILNPQLEIGGGDFSIARSPGDYTKQTTFSSAMPLLNASPGSVSSGSASIFPNVAAQNFDLGVLAATRYSAYYDPTKAAYYYHAEKLLVPSLGLAASALGGRFKLGVEGRVIQINETNMSVAGPGNAAFTGTDSARSGLGFGVDAGTLLTLPWAGLPTLGLVARNIGGTSFPSPQMIPLGSSVSAQHEIEKMTYDGGIAFTSKMAQKDFFTFSTDYRDVLNSTGAVAIRHLNVGMELGLFKLLFFRAGFTQGYWTAGFGLDSKVGSIDLGTHAEELDPTAYHAIEDRQYTMKLTRRF